MPKRKSLPKIEGAGKSISDGLIQKTRPLLTLSNSNLTLPEFKLLDLYLARINSHNPDVRTVELERGELEKALGITKINRKDLLKRLKGMYQSVELVNEENRIKTTVLFEEADAERDVNSGLWTITLTCTKRAMKYIFNVENIGYLRYRLKCVLDLTSRYSYVLFLYLLDNRFRGNGTWVISLSELKALLNCTADAYGEYKRFNDLVLKKCHKEITEKTDLKFTYKSLRKGRTVDRVEFTVEHINDYIEDKSEPPVQIEGQITADSLEPLYSEDDYTEKRYEFLAEACDLTFSETEVAVLNELLLKLQEAAKIENKGNREDKELSRYHYMQQKYKELKMYEQRKLSEGKPIKDRFAYIRKMLEKELG